MSSEDNALQQGVDRPLCFVLMPFGIKPDPTGGPSIDFNSIYHTAIKPGIVDAGLQPIRADEESTIGIIHKPMFERLMLADFAVADMTTGNANVFYELGVRHTARPSTTLTLFASHQPIPFDVNFLRSVPYELGPGNKFGEEQAKKLRGAVTEWLIKLRDNAKETAAVDSPVFELIGEWQPGDIARIKTDAFRHRVKYNDTLKSEIAEARTTGGEAGCTILDNIQEKIAFDGVEAGVLVDLFLSRRGMSDWDGMIQLYDRFPEVIKRQILLREQLALALNRRAGRDNSESDRDRAVELLHGVLDEQGPSSETCGLIGRIHKDRWMESREADPLTARGHLELAIESYVQGFQADWRDAYPGINATTLLDIEGSDESLVRKDDILPVVRYAALQRASGSNPDYWDYATMCELEVLADDSDKALDWISKALAVVREGWEASSTANNLKLIRDARTERGEDAGWIETIEQALLAKAD